MCSWCGDGLSWTVLWALQVQSGDEQAVEARLFAAVCWGPGDPATTMVMLNRDGQLVDVLYAGQLSGAIRRTRRSAQGVEDIFLDPAKARTLFRLPACCSAYLWYCCVHKACRDMFPAPMRLR